ncbi:hypothetical protein FE783_10790 [Paenibacillus mesophilus]|uniref:hypothetical protein n=1 Tax=Paenibacillus mesophilus TaxID=2582849 RepID=UPI00110E41D7|nr:hypothetical protein [Paenibacillus mesophilus]TMV50043.1 hypothetical protein FE783_10790 [Paenibacillus mesophilus]
MRYVTETRLKLLEDLCHSIPDRKDRSYALHLLDSIRADIDNNYAEIQRPIQVSGMSRWSDARNITD